MANAARPLFMPAPRPVARASAGEVAELERAVAELGFGRASSPPQGAEPAAPSREAAPKPPAARPRPSRSRAAPVSPGVRDEASLAELPGAPRPVPAHDPFGKGLPLRLDVPEALWIDLKTRAVQRRVTVRWLVLEALEAAGYDVSSRTIPLDGRRVR